MFFQLDLERIWYRSWLFAVPVCELPKPGSYVVHKVGLYSVMIVRGSDGVVPGLSQHLPASRLDALSRREGNEPEDRLPLSPVDVRARRQLALGAGHGRRLRPAAARPKAGPLPRGRRPRLHLPRRRRSAPSTPSPSRPTRYLAPHDLANSKVAHESTIIEKGNWKLVWENNRECYHCAGQPPVAAAAPSPRTRALERQWRRGTARDDARQARRALRGRRRAVSLQHRSRRPVWRFVRMPLLARRRELHDGRQGGRRASRTRRSRSRTPARC